MFEIIPIFFIFIVCIIKKIFVRTNDFEKNRDLFEKLAHNTKQILNDNIVNFIRTGSTVCGISVGSSDVDMGIFVKDPTDAINTLQNNGYVITKKYDHYINLTKVKNPITNNFDSDVKIYFDRNELNRLKIAIEKYHQKIKTVERYWLIAQKIWFDWSQQPLKYENVKIAFYKKHGILK